MTGFLVFLVLALVVVLLCRKSVERVAAGHAHGHGRTLLRHESGHIVAAEQTGTRVKKIHLGVLGDSYVQLNRQDAENMSPRDYMAFMLSGRYAAGTGAGCSSDDKQVKVERDRLRRHGWSPAQVRREVRQAESDARRYARSGRVDYWADRLDKGKL